MLESELIEIKPKGDSDHNSDIGILILKPHGALDKSDFERVSTNLYRKISRLDRLFKPYLSLQIYSTPP